MFFLGERKLEWKAGIWKKRRNEEQREVGKLNVRVRAEGSERKETLEIVKSLEEIDLFNSFFLLLFDENK